MEEARRFAKQLELRDSITLVFGSKAVLDQLVPSNHGNCQDKAESNWVNSQLYK